MANPRQKRKQKSSNHRPVRHAKHAKKNLKKMPREYPHIFLFDSFGYSLYSFPSTTTSTASPQTFAGRLGSAFNRQTKVSFPVTRSSGLSSLIGVSTLSYTALGLLPSLNPRAKGGAEIVPDITLLPQPDPSAISKPPRSSPTAVASVPKGHGRILRDKHGNVVDVQLNEEDRDEEIMHSQEDREPRTPWGAPMEDWGNEGEAMPGIEGKTKVIKGTLLHHSLIFH